MKGKEMPDFNRVVSALLADVEAHEKAQLPDPPDGHLAPKDPEQKSSKELKAVPK